MMSEEKALARRPLPDASATDRELGEGRLSSPSNPTIGKQDLHRNTSGGLDIKVTFRCTSVEKNLLIEKAQNAGLPFSDLLREALGLVSNRRRKPIPKVDPDFIRAISSIGSNVNQIARWVNHATAAGHLKEVEAAMLASRLVALDRTLKCLTISAETGALPGSEQC
ncbi:MAG: plasmid mobilization relaxosome protein MobC [Pseudomonadota bacterium]